MSVRSLAVTYFHGGRPPTIIGADAFHGPVRDGKAWFRIAMAARQIVRVCNPLGRVVVRLCVCCADPTPLWRYMVKPHGRLVRVSCIHYWTSTPRLSTSSSSTGLEGALSPGRSHLEVGFALRCFQRLSLPYIATRQCPWQDNRHTSGTSTPVLSY